METLTVPAVAALFGATVDELRASAGPLLNDIDWRVAPVAGAERDRLLLSVMRRIDDPQMKAAGTHRHGDWEDGWGENLHDFVASEYAFKALIPKYYRPNAPIRLEGRYVVPVMPDFVYRYTEVFRAWLFAKFMAPYTSVYEFGCGTGHNLVHLAQVDPAKKLVGLDWANSSQQILKLLAEKRGLNISGGRFDFFNPDPALTLEPNACVFTFGALEQIGADHGKWLEFLLERKPGVCIDVIGCEELYDDGDLLDYLARRYHRKRGYLAGYLTALQSLEASGRIEIAAVQRHRFGNLYDDPYSFVVWKPR